ncbi:MAG: hypothetical protein R6V45_08480 [Oceanipulchritudo sp.]
MTYLKRTLSTAGLALAVIPALGQTEISVVAADNGTIEPDGPSGSPWFHNAQAAGDFAAYGISTFNLDADAFDVAEVTSINEMEIAYTQSNAGFTTDGPVEFYITFDPAAGSADYSALAHDGTANGVEDSQFSDSPTEQQVATGTFTEVESGTVDTYTLDVSEVEAELVEAINDGSGFSIIISATGSEGAVTYAGIQNNGFPDSIILTVTAEGESGGGNGGGGTAGEGLIITGVLDGPLPGGLPKAIELYALSDIPDLSIYGFGSANNGGGSDGEELVLSGSAAAGDFLYIATEEVEFTNVFGFAPEFVSNSAAINGDDAIELFKDGQVIDTFGDIDTDGSGEPWEYLDSWAYRVDETSVDPAFAIDDWTFGGPNALDGLDAGAVAEAFPFGTWVPGEAPVVEELPWEAEGLEVGDVSVSPWFGSFELSSDGWVRHGEQGWLYVGLVQSVDNLWIYSLHLDAWTWSSSETFPVVYDTAGERWVVYLILEEAGVFLFDYSEGIWIANP